MSTTTTNYGLIKPDTTDPILIGQLNDNADTIDATMKSISDALDVAKLGIKYKGEVNYYADLPNSAEIGDAYTVKYAGSSGTTPDGTEYVWGTVSGTNQWINFSKDSYTKAEVDALLVLKVDTAGTGLSKSGTTLNHSNSTTAKTTQGFAQIAYDAQGHITGSTAATTAQANAINSGIDSTKVAQIETNKNNISDDRAALVELVDGGAKNLFYMTATSGGTNVIYTVSNGTILLNGTATYTPTTIFLGNIFLEANRKYIITGCPQGGTDSSYRVDIRDTTGSITYAKDYGEGAEFTPNTSEIYQMLIRLVAGYQLNNVMFKPMICTPDDYAISPEFVAYRPSYQELYERVVALEQANQ